MLDPVDTERFVELDTQTTTVVDHMGGEITFGYHLEDAFLTDLIEVTITDSTGDVVKQRRYHNPWLVQTERWKDLTDIYVDRRYADLSAEITFYHDPERDRLPPAKADLETATVETTVENGYAAFDYQTGTELDHDDLLGIRRVEGVIYDEAGTPVETWRHRHRFPIGTPPAYYTQRVTPPDGSDRGGYDGLNAEITLYLDESVRVVDSNNPHPTPILNVYYEEVGPNIRTTDDGESVDVFDIPPLYCDDALVSLHAETWSDDRTYRLSGRAVASGSRLTHDGEYVGHTAGVTYFEGVPGRLRRAADAAASLRSTLPGQAVVDR